MQASSGLRSWRAPGAEEGRHDHLLGRSLTNLIELMTLLSDREICFKSLSEQIDTTTSSVKLVFHIFGALAKFERELIRERIRAGFAAARARGQQGGRRKRRNTPKKIAMAQASTIRGRIRSTTPVKRWVSHGRPSIA